jgi:hypothetical protein
MTFLDGSEEIKKTAYTAHMLNTHDPYVICRYNPLAVSLPSQNIAYLYNIFYHVPLQEKRIKL